MKKSIRNKIEGFKKLAQASKEAGCSVKHNNFSRTEDSLSKLITNQRDADFFMAELRAAIKMAKEARYSQ